MTRQPLRLTVLAISLTALCLLAAPVGARDRAYVGGGGDPALVGGYSTPAASAAPGLPPSSAGSQAAMQQEESIKDAENLLQRLRGEIGGTAIETYRADEPSATGGRGREINNALRYRAEVETMVREHWDQLGPLTRDLYSANYDRSNPDDNSQRYRSPYGDNSQLENKLLGATDDVQGSMQNLEDLLLPMLKDLKQGFDDGLRQQRFNQR
jgi:hypothetical protein